MNFSYRQASPTDKKAIFDIYRLVMSELIGKIWGWNEEWQIDDFDKHFIPENINLVYFGNDLIGYSQVDNQSNHKHLRMLVIHPAYQRNGIGSKLLRSFITSQKENPVKLSLEVFKINTIAKEFYEKSGFTVERETSTSYAVNFQN